jgi:outer membrane lipoprotein-sorting protein
MRVLNIVSVLALLILASVVFIPKDALTLTGDEVLKRAEDVMNAPKDRMMKEKMTLLKSGGSKKELTIVIHQKGVDKRLIVFLSPADVKGVGFLSLTENTMYLYMPAFRKIRRIASHIKNEGFMGTDFSYEDLSETRFTDEYSATLVKEEANVYVLELTPKSGADVGYSKQRMWVDKKTFFPAKTEYFSKRDVLIKRLTSEDVEKVDGYWVPMKMTMVTLKSGHRTVLETIEVEHDSGISDQFFTKRNLKKQAR